MVLLVLHSSLVVCWGNVFSVLASILTSRTVPVSFYSDMFQRLSVSSQHVVVAFDFLGGIAKDYVDAGQRVNRAISWFNEHHSELFPEGLKVDMSNAVFVTHSSGIQSILMLWKENLLQQIKALILIDPVDAIFDQVTSDKTKALPRDSHLMVMSTGLCETAALEVPAPWFMNTTKWNLPPIFDEGRLWPSCCPKGLSSGRFLNYLSDHSVLHLNYTQYGHCDLLDDRWVWINNLFRFCKSATDQRLSRRESNVFDLSEFRHNVVAAVSSFTQYALTGSRDRIDEALNTTWAQQNIVINWNKA